jgi:hypothetical protein
MFTQLPKNCIFLISIQKRIQQKLFLFFRMRFTSKFPSYQQYADLIAKFKICNCEKICDFILSIKQTN